MKQYHDLLNKIINYGDYKPPARENMPGTYSLFGPQMEFDLRDGFPIVTTKKVSFKNIVVELLWMLKGITHTKFLVENNCNIWSEDSFAYYNKIASKNTGQYANDIYHKNEDGSFRMFIYKEFVDIIKNNSFYDLFINYSVVINDYHYVLGDTGKQYGWLMREWAGDQFKTLIKGLQKSPNSRRHIISNWNPETLNDMSLHACHSFVQFNCVKIPIGPDSLDAPQYYLDCKLYQRSADSFLGVPYNTSSYALLMNIVGKMVNMIPRFFIHSFGDCHIYDNHYEQVQEQLKRDPYKYDLPRLEFNDKFELDLNWYKGNNEVSEFIDNLEPDMFSLDNYQSYPSISAPLSTGITK